MPLHWIPIQLLTRGLQWSSFENQYLLKYVYWYGDTTLNGFWRNDTHFAGIRMINQNGTSYGWIRMNTDSTITVIDFALEGK